MVVNSIMCEFESTLIAVTDWGNAAEQVIQDIVAPKQLYIDEGLGMHSTSGSDIGKNSLRAV